MARLTQSQIEMYARAAGMANPDIAAAVAMAESGGDPKARNPVPPDNSYGLWQINMLGSLGTDRRRKLGISSNSALYDPAVNARAAAMISNNGTNWKPWATYTGQDGKGSDGPWRDYYKGGNGGGTVDQAALTPGMDAVGAGMEWLGGYEESVDLLLDASNMFVNPHFWVRIAYGVVGGALVLIGVAMMTGVTGQAKKVVSVATDLAPGVGTAKAAVRTKRAALTAKAKAASEPKKAAAPAAKKTAAPAAKKTAAPAAKKAAPAAAKKTTAAPAASGGNAA